MKFFWRIRCLIDDFRGQYQLRKLEYAARKVIEDRLKEVMR